MFEITIATTVIGLVILGRGLRNLGKKRDGEKKIIDAELILRNKVKSKTEYLEA